MRILIVSDTHGRVQNFEKVVGLVKPDRVFHLGDYQGQEHLLQKIAGCPLTIVQGNCDFYSDVPEEETVTVGKHRIFLCHGHEYNVRYTTRILAEEAAKRRADAALFGHTHVPEILYEPVGDQVITLVNPGSISLPRQENRLPSYAVLNEEDGEIRFSICYLRD